MVLISGGIDSAACVHLFQKQQSRVRGIHIAYGQPADQRESAAASAIAAHYRIPLSTVYLVGSRHKVGGEIFGRNAFLLFTALMEIDIRPALLALGIHSGTPYPDCSPRFIATVQATIDLQCAGSIKVVAPFLEWAKSDIWRYCITEHVPLELTYSCELGLTQPCGKCSSCKDLETLRVCQKIDT